MGLTPRSLHRARQKVWLNIRHFRERIHHEALTPWKDNKLARRVTALWVGSLALVIVLSLLQTRSLRNFYMQLAGQPGGTYTEGIIGSITTINPILADSGANADASRLVFSGLTRYNHEGEVEGDLARTWTVSPDGRTYTFTLRPGITWQDGRPFTSADVVFTIGLIQNPDTRSPMTSAWQGVEATSPDPATVVLTLPIRYDAFINSTNVGILPQHVLQSTPAADLRISNFNQAPIGTGPFSISSFDTDNGSVVFKGNTAYFRGKPKLDSLVLKVYTTQAELQSAFRKHQIMGMARSANSAGTSYGRGANLHSLDIPEEVALFMRTRSAILSDATVRSAVAGAIDRQEIIKAILHNEAKPLAVPALPSQLPVAASYTIPAKDINQSKKQLDEAGWKQNGGEARTKDGRELRLKLVTAQTDDYQAVSQRISRQLLAIGVVVDIQAVDVATLQRTYITPRDYDLLLYGLNAGADLDPYPYWHSSQAKAPGLNVSQYSSAAADKALVSARTTTDAQVRQVRLKSFLDAWKADNPAVMLYTPGYLYVTNDEVQGVIDGELVTAADRFYNVQNWTVRSRLVPRI